MLQQSFQIDDIVRLENAKIFGLQDSDREIILRIDSIDHDGVYRVEFLNPDDKVFLCDKRIIGNANDDVRAAPGCLSLIQDYQDYCKGIEQEFDELFD